MCSFIPQAPVAVNLTYLHTSFLFLHKFRRQHNPNGQARTGNAVGHSGGADSGCRRVAGGVEQEAGRRDTLGTDCVPTASFQDSGGL